MAPDGIEDKSFVIALLHLPGNGDELLFTEREQFAGRNLIKKIDLVLIIDATGIIDKDFNIAFQQRDYLFPIPKGQVITGLLRRSEKIENGKGFAIAERNQVFFVKIGIFFPFLIERNLAGLHQLKNFSQCTLDMDQHFLLDLFLTDQQLQITNRFVGAKFPDQRFVTVPFGNFHDPDLLSRQQERRILQIPLPNPSYQPQIRFTGHLLSKIGIK